MTLRPIRRFCCKQTSRLGEALHRFLDRRQPGEEQGRSLDMSYLSRSGKESNPAFVIVCEIRGDVGYSWEVPVRFDRRVTRIYGPGSSDRSAGSAVGPRRVESRNCSSETIRTQSFGSFGMGITGSDAQERAKITPRMRCWLVSRVPSSPLPGALDDEIKPSCGLGRGGSPVPTR